MVKDHEEKVQKPPEVPTICTKESTRSGAPTLATSESINGRLIAFCFATSYFKSAAKQMRMKATMTKAR